LGNRIADFAAAYPFDADIAGAARDLARYELAFVAVFDGPDVLPLPLERVQSFAPEDWASALLMFQPRLLLLTLDHPVYELRAALKRCEQPARRIEPKKTLLSMWRGDDLKVHYLALQEQEHALLQRLRAGATLVEACDAMAGLVQPNDISRWFRAWAERGWIVDVL